MASQYYTKKTLNKTLFEVLLHKCFPIIHKMEHVRVLNNAVSIWQTAHLTGSYNFYENKG